MVAHGSALQMVQKLFVGVKAEVEKTKSVLATTGEVEAEDVLELGTEGAGDVDMDEEDGEDKIGGRKTNQGKGEDSWLEISIEIPGMRDDDALPVFLSAMLTEALLADGELKDRLWMNRRFHWRLYIDVGPRRNHIVKPTNEDANGKFYLRYYSFHSHSHIRSHYSH